MIVKNNYHECLTNLACSIRKYFGLEYHHNTLEEIDKILEDNNPKNIVTILFDGMGSRILDKVLPQDSFFIKHRIKPITTVFPPTTVAATTSMITGLNPIESGMLGWNTYFKEIDKTIATFAGFEKGDSSETVLEEALAQKEEYMKTKAITDSINEMGKDKGYRLFPFGEDSYSDLHEMFDRIETLCNQPGKKYIYAYDTEPDHTMHVLGRDPEQVKGMVIERNNLVEKLAQKLTDTVIFVVADHGHIPVEPIFLEEYPDIVDCLSHNTSVEPRATSFFVKEEKKEIFKSLFQQYFSDAYDLYTKEEILESKLFGDGEENRIVKDALGDFFAIAKGNKIILFHGDKNYQSHHGGNTDDEIYVPLIVIVKK